MPACFRMACKVPVGKSLLCIGIITRIFFLFDNKFDERPLNGQKRNPSALIILLIL